MVLQKIPSDFLSTIYKKKPIRIIRYNVVTGEQTPDMMLIPPLNTNIDTSVLPRFDPAVHAVMIDAPTVKNIPSKHQKKFNWYDDRRDDQTSKINEQITPVGNQEQCGSCWAYSTATAVSDVFVVGNKTDKNPRCSATYALSCYPHCKSEQDPSSCEGRPTRDIPYSLQCNGGLPASLLLWISRNGIGSDDCEDYSWCMSNPLCINGGADMTTMNSYIPECECKEKNTKLYFISEPILQGLSKERPTETDIETHRSIVKKWIYNYGTVVAGFIVYQNIMSGNFVSFDKNPEGIYLEDVDYTTMELFHNRVNQPEGGHAVCIVGWGEGPVSNSLIADPSLRNPEGSTTIVPYWVVRNSWSPQWGQKGLFKMAMYPFNKIAQFDNIVVDGGGQIGGICLFSPSLIKTRENYMSFFSNNNNNNLWIWLTIILIIYFVIVFMIMYRYHKK